MVVGASLEMLMEFLREYLRDTILLCHGWYLVLSIRVINLPNETESSRGRWIGGRKQSGDEGIGLNRDVRDRKKGNQGKVLSFFPAVFNGLV